MISFSSIINYINLFFINYSMSFFSRKNFLFPDWEFMKTIDLGFSLIKIIRNKIINRFTKKIISGISLEARKFVKFKPLISFHYLILYNFQIINFCKYIILLGKIEEK